MKEIIVRMTIVMKCETKFENIVVTTVILCIGYGIDFPYGNTANKTLYMSHRGRTGDFEL